MSFGLPVNGRRSTPTTCASVCRSFASARPRFPAIPVTRTVAGIPGTFGGSAPPLTRSSGRSQVDAPALGEPAVEERADRALHLRHLPFELRVVVVGRAREPERLSEPDVIAGRE